MTKKFVPGDNYIPKDKQFAFWKYDQFPYCLGGTVTKILDNGNVETKEFGVGYYFKPFLLTDLKTGQNIKTNLGYLEETRRQTLETISKGFDLQLKQFIQLPRGY